MAKKKAEEQEVQQEEINPFMGGEDDDLMDMEYVQDESTVSVDTHPPETEEEAAQRAEQEKEEEDEEKEEVPEAKEEEKEPEPEPEVAEDTKIPKDRFDEVNQRMKEAEKRVKELKQQLEDVVEKSKAPEPEPDPFDYAAKEQEAADALLEGDNQKYAQIRAEIRAAEREETLREARRIASEGDQHLQENLTFEEAGARIEQEIPQLNIESDQFNEAAREEMLDLYVGYAKSGVYSRVEALQRAADRISRIYSFKREPEPEPAPDNVVDIKKTDAKRKAAAANAQPPVVETSTEGRQEESRRNVMNMTDAEFEALPESTKRRMRGDIV